MLFIPNGDENTVQVTLNDRFNVTLTPHRLCFGDEQYYSYKIKESEFNIETKGYKYRVVAKGLLEVRE